MKNLREGEHFPETFQDFQSSYSSGSWSPGRATREYLRRISASNPALNCFITVLDQSALKAAEESDQRHKEGRPLGPLDGVPVAIKDLIYIEGVRSTAGSKVLADNIAPYDAPVIRRLKAGGAIILGTTNMHEFAAGVTNVNPHYGSVKNPWDESRMSGGSSGGSAVSVASGLAAAALGTDTGGSVRIPAALCGVLGLKPNYGRVSRLGVVPLSSSLDTVGVLTKSARDAAVLLDVLSGHEEGDLTTVVAEVPGFSDSLSKPFSAPRIGIARDYFFDRLDPAVEANFEEFSSKLRALGCTVRDAQIDWIGGTYDRWLPIRKAEATAFHLKWLDSAPQLYGEDVRALLEEGRSVSAVEYVSAINARPSYMERFSDTMSEFDVLMVPCTDVTAPGLDQRMVTVKGREMDVRSALIRPSIPFNYIGCPVLSFPSGFVNGLPVGVQLVGRFFDEATLLRLALELEIHLGRFPAAPHTSWASTG